MLPPADAYSGACHSGVPLPDPDAELTAAGATAAGAAPPVASVLLPGSALTGGALLPGPTRLLRLVLLPLLLMAGCPDRMPQLVGCSVLVVVDMLLLVVLLLLLLLVVVLYSSRRAQRRGLAKGVAWLGLRLASSVDRSIPRATQSGSGLLLLCGGYEAKRGHKRACCCQWRAACVLLLLWFGVWCVGGWSVRSGRRRKQTKTL